MSKIIRILLISFLLFPAFGFSEEEAKSVIVSGTGGTREIALSNAFRSAVEQAVGLMVSSQSYVTNLKTIQDKVFVASDGFIETYDVLSDQSDVTGHAVTIKAVVRKKPLQQAITNATGISFSGASLFANLSLREDKAKAYSVEVADMLDSLIEKGFEYQYGALEAIKVEGKDNAYYVKVPYLKILITNEWLKNLKNYRDKLTDESIYDDAIKINGATKGSYDRHPGLKLPIVFVFEMQDLSENVIGKKESYAGRNSSYGAHINITQKYGFLSEITGFFEKSEFRYPDISEDERIFAVGVTYPSPMLLGPFDQDDLKRLSKLVIRAVGIRDYGGRLATYRYNSPDD